MSATILAFPRCQSAAPQPETPAGLDYELSVLQTMIQCYSAAMHTQFEKCAALIKARPPKKPRSRKKAP